MDSAKTTRVKQYLKIIGIMAAVFIVIQLSGKFFKQGDSQSKDSLAKMMSIPTAGNADLQNHWVQKLETRNKDLEKKMSETLSQVEQQNKAMDKLRQEMTASSETIVKKLEEQNQAGNLQKSPALNTSDPFPAQGATLGYNTTSKQTISGGSNVNTTMPLSLQPNIVSHSLKLVNQKQKHRLDNYIPAGSFSKAIILGGIDAAAGISSQSEPRPVLLRLVDLSVLPNRARHDFQDCHVVAAGYGDISSERAYIRTERLSCTLKTGVIFEQKIKAYVAGEDGKDGLKGNVLRREGDLIFNSFMAGAISGLGKGMSQSFGTTSVSPLGSTKTLAGSDVLKSGAYGGVGEGADDLQKYFIKRAEQMQPVVQISAGREVTIVFLEGVELEDLKTH